MRIVPTLGLATRRRSRRAARRRASCRCSRPLRRRRRSPRRSARAAFRIAPAWGLLRDYERKPSAPRSCSSSAAAARASPLSARNCCRRRPPRASGLRGSGAASRSNRARPPANERASAAPARRRESRPRACGAVRGAARHQRGRPRRVGDGEPQRAAGIRRRPHRNRRLPRADRRARGAGIARPSSNGCVARRDKLIRFVDREQGLILPRGNPARVRSLRGVVERKLRFINRQRGSATRLLIDRMLADERRSTPSALEGFGNEEFTHPAVAATVASGGADAGFGLRAAAAEYGLAFVPLVRERYFLAVRAKDAVEAAACPLDRRAEEPGVRASACAACPATIPTGAGSLTGIEVLAAAPAPKARRR